MGDMMNAQEIEKVRFAHAYGEISTLVNRYDEEEDDTPLLPEAVLMPRAEILRLFQDAVAAARQELAAKQAEKDWADQQTQTEQKAKILTKLDNEVEDAQAVLRRYRTHSRTLITLSGASAGVALMGTTFFTINSVTGWILLIAGVIATLVFGVNGSGMIFDAHKTKDVDNGTRKISQHPAEVLRRKERERTNWLNGVG